METIPFSVGSIAFGLHLHELPPVEAIQALRREAKLAEEAGFDGVTLAEHHAGVPLYLPNPIQAATFLLPTLKSAWAAPCPTLVTLRSAVTVAEDVGWLAAAFPGRVGVGFAPGYFAADFETVGVPFSGRAARYAAALKVIGHALGGKAEGNLARDPALAACAKAPVPTVGAAGGPLTVQRTAEAGVGLLFDSGTPKERLIELLAAYHAHGGIGPYLLNRRVWVGDLPEGIDAERRMGGLRVDAGLQMAPPTNFSPSESISGHPDEVIARILGSLNTVGPAGLHLKIYSPGVTHSMIMHQIERLGKEVLPELRRQIH
jgi:alkanesulfonate monooxygenase SsuD/methylene tetrahydromethanopterin reductase-like flavin-dependent oxidoreductase (luciferase family)